MNTEIDDFLAKAVTVQRLIVGALIFGVVNFAVVVVVLHALDVFTPIGGLEYLTYAGLGMLGLAVLMQFVLLPILDTSARDSIDAKSEAMQPWLQAFTSRTIVGCALLEGAAFLCLIGALLDGQVVGLIGAATAAALMFVLHWPSEAKVQAYVDRQRELAMNGR